MARAKSNDDPLLGELATIKRLLVLALIRSGANQTEIAGALGVDRSQVSRMFPGGAAKPKRAGKTKTS